MKKDLPGLYANRIDKPLHNNEKVAVTKNEDRTLEKEELHISSKNNINRKIKNIFESPRYVYKADVVITLKDKKITKKIVGKNQSNLITFDNELIPIDDIIDIEFSK